MSLFRGNRFNVVGRVNMNEKIPMSAHFDTGFKLHCAGSGFEMIVDLKGRKKRRGRRIVIGSDRIICRLTDGTTLQCEGYLDAETLRIDAKDQENFAWFWFAVNRVY